MEALTFSFGQSAGCGINQSKLEMLQEIRKGLIALDRVNCILIIYC